MILPKVRGGFGVVYADPPWKFETWSAKGRDRCPDARHYDVMPLDAIKALPVGAACAPDCALFLWATDPMLTHALEVGASWGFKYKTVAFYWVKTKPGERVIFGSLANVTRALPIGTGRWTRANPEMCLLFTRGAPKRRDASIRKVILSERREHSRKPDETYGRIEALVDGPYLELFARQKRPGWRSFGDQRDKFTAVHE